jgi:hypothetical protein
LTIAKKIIRLCPGGDGMESILDKFGRIIIGVAFDKFKADSLLTFNHRDFSRIFSDRKNVLIIP